mmetsp:Transcript_7074/g.25186  ORF Transcript_7074/g.25186 Transcript_7074/m.25186 type:complete len:434 (+) Transcript_7074:2412-3713(+)
MLLRSFRAADVTEETLPPPSLPSSVADPLPSAALPPSSDPMALASSTSPLPRCLRFGVPLSFSVFGFFFFLFDGVTTEKALPDPSLCALPVLLRRLRRRRGPSLPLCPSSTVLAIDDAALSALNTRSRRPFAVGEPSPDETAEASVSALKMRARGCLTGDAVSAAESADSASLPSAPSPSLPSPVVALSLRVRRGFPDPNALPSPLSALERRLRIRGFLFCGVTKSLAPLSDRCRAGVPVTTLSSALVWVSPPSDSKRLRRLAFFDFAADGDPSSSSVVVAPDASVLSVSWRLSLPRRKLAFIACTRIDATRCSSLMLPESVSVAIIASRSRRSCAASESSLSASETSSSTSGVVPIAPAPSVPPLVAAPASGEPLGTALGPAEPRPVMVSNLFDTGDTMKPIWSKMLTMRLSPGMRRCAGVWPSNPSAWSLS